MAKETEEIKIVGPQKDVGEFFDDDMNKDMEPIDDGFYGQTGTLGSKDFEQNDITYGWLKIAQANSQVAMKGHQKYIKGMEAGVFYNSMTGEILGSELDLVYLKFFRSYTEYEGEQKGQGEYVRNIPKAEFNAMVKAKAIVSVEGKGLRFPGNEKNYVVEYANYMVCIANRLDLGPLRFQLGMGSIRQVKIWDTLIDTAFLPNEKPAPKWAYAWRVGLALDFNNKTNSSYWNIGQSSQANITRGERVKPGTALAEMVLKGFKFFQENSEEAIDKAGEEEYIHSEGHEDTNI